MATLEQEKQASDRLKSNLDKLSKITPESLVRNDKLGELNFEAGLITFRRILKLFNDLKMANLDGISFSALNSLNNNAENALTLFNQILTFSITPHNNPTQVRNQYLQQIQDFYDPLYAVLTPHIAYSIRKGTDFEALEQNARQLVADIHESQTESIQQQEKYKKESNEILEAMRKAAIDTGISQHSFLFANEADQHKKSAKSWLYGTIAVGVIAIILALYSINLYASNISSFSTAQSIQFGITKIIAFSILYFGLIWSGRNYKAHRHNFVINKHRQNALNTFQAFVKELMTRRQKMLCYLEPQRQYFHNLLQDIFRENQNHKQALRYLRFLEESSTSGPIEFINGLNTNFMRPSRRSRGDPRYSALKARLTSYYPNPILKQYSRSLFE